MKYLFSVLTCSAVHRPLQELSLPGTEAAVRWTDRSSPADSRTGPIGPVQQTAGPAPDFLQTWRAHTKLTTGFTTLRSDTPASSFLVPPTVRILSLSLNTATSGRGRQQREKHPDTINPTYKPDTTNSHFAQHRHNRPQSPTPAPASQRLHHLLICLIKSRGFGLNKVLEWSDGERGMQLTPCWGYRSHTTTNPTPTLRGFPNRKPFCTGHLHHSGDATSSWTQHWCPQFSLQTLNTQTSLSDLKDVFHNLSLQQAWSALDHFV